MSDIPTNPMGDPVEPIPVATTGEGVAERFIDKELVESRASLKRTQIVSVVLSVFVVGFMGYLTSGWRSYMEPKEAATVVTGMASQRLDDLEPQFSSYIREQVPEMIRKAPDEVIARMPEYRKNLEERVDESLRAQAKQGADQLNKQLDDFLTAHKEEVGELLKNGDDPATMQKFGTALEESFKKFMDEQKIGSETIQQKMDATLATLKQVSARTKKLAMNQGLTANEKNARHAVAMLMRRIDAAKALEPDAIKPIDPNVLKAHANQAVENVKGAVDAARDHVQTHMPESLKPTAPASASPAPAAPAPKPAAPAPKKP